jgi:hypothetical protein
MGARVVRLVAILGSSAGLALLAAVPSSAGGIGDRALSLSLPAKGWTALGGSATLIVAGQRRKVSQLVAANFTLPRHSPNYRRGALLVPPPSRLIISLIDFAPTGQAHNWRSVTHLSLPPRAQSPQLWIARVRFNKRAVLVRVLFGSTPTVAALLLADHVLRTVAPGV